MRKKHISAEPIYRLRYYIPQDCLDMSHAVNYLARDRHCFTCLLWLHSHIFCNVFLLADWWMDGWMGVHWMNSFKINALHDCMKYDIEIPMISYVWGWKKDLCICIIQWRTPHYSRLPSITLSMAKLHRKTIESPQYQAMYFQYNTHTQI